MKISAFTPVYSGTYLVQTMDSVFAQSLKPADYVLTVDGKSETFTIIKDYFDQKGFPLVQHKDIFITEYLGIKIKVRNREINLGIGATLNDCINLCEGDCLAWVSADDEMTPQRLEISLKKYESLGCPEEVLYGDYDTEDKKTGNIIGYVRGIDFKDLQAEKDYVMRGCFVNFSTTLIPRKVFDKVGLFDPSKRFGEDYEWLMRAILVYDVFFKYIPAVLVHYGIDVNEQETHKKLDKIALNDQDSREKIQMLLKQKEEIK